MMSSPLKKKRQTGGVSFCRDERLNRDGAHNQNNLRQPTAAAASASVASASASASGVNSFTPFFVQCQ